MPPYNKLREIKMDIRYRNGKIYILKHKDSDKQYIGSTIKTLNARLGGHKADYKQYLKGTQHYITCYELFDLGIDGIYIELLENYPCGNIISLEARETYYIKNNDCINTHIPYRTSEEWEEYHRERYKVRDAKRAQIKVSCRICRKEYSIKTFPIHFRNIHENKTIKLSCRICRKEMNKASFTKHLREVHEN